MTKLKCGILTGLVVVVVVTTTVVTKPNPNLCMPNPNGYAYFVKAGQMVSNEPVQGSVDLDQLDEAGLRAVVSQNAEGLKIARQGFAYPSRAADNDATNLEDTILPLFKQLGLAFSAEGKLAEMENRKADAIRSYLDDVRLGQESSRGGTIIVRLVGVALERIGLKPLQSLAKSGDCNQCKQAALALELLDAKEPPLKDALEQERASEWSLPKENMLMRLAWRLIQNKMMAPSIQRATGRTQTNQLILRQTMIAFAARAYELEKKHPPKSLGDLTPGYLKAIPKDPRTGKDMVYPP